MKILVNLMCTFLIVSCGAKKNSQTNTKDASANAEATVEQAAVIIEEEIIVSFKAVNGLQSDERRFQIGTTISVMNQEILNMVNERKKKARSCPKGDCSQMPVPAKTPSGDCSHGLCDDTPTNAFPDGECPSVGCQVPEK